MAGSASASSVVRVVRMLRYARPYRRARAAIAVLSLVGSVAALLGPWPVKVLLDHVLSDQPMRPWMARLFDALPGGASVGGRIGLVVVGGLALFAIGSLVEALLTMAWTRVG